MSGIKGFSIITIVTLLIAFMFIGIGRGEELTQEEFKKQYEEATVGHIDESIDVITRVDIKDIKHRTFKNLTNPWFLCDFFDNNEFNLFFGYEEFESKKLKVKGITINNIMPIVFYQNDEVFKHRPKHKSLVVFELLPEMTKVGKDILVTIDFEENKMGIIRKEFVIYSQQVDYMFQTIEDWFKEYIKNPKIKG